MKRMILLLLAVFVLLSGCRGEPMPTEVTSVASTVTEAPAVTAPAFTLMDSCQITGDGNNVWYIPNEQVENPFSSLLYAFGDDLLLGSYLTDYDENGETAEQRLELKRISLAADPHRRNLMLYHPDGTFISHCNLPNDEMSYAGTDLIWSEHWGGYFFLDYTAQGTKLVFWDVGAESSGENLALRDIKETAIPEEGVVDAALYDRALELSRRFGVDIRIADRCALEYSHYTSAMETNPDYIAAALDVLEQSLSNYPEGFFEQLRYGNVRSLRIELVGHLMPIEDASMVGAAFAQELYDHNLIVMDTYSVSPWNIYHEISHIIDNRLAFDVRIRPDALFSEQTWLALQPEGFDYAYSYWEMSGNTAGYIDSGYFIDSYACTFPTEDRAELMEAAMSGEPIFMDNELLRRKLSFYCQCIRDCFDTTGWPEVTLWEQPLGVG